MFRLDLSDHLNHEMGEDHSITKQPLVFLNNRKTRKNVMRRICLIQKKILLARLKIVRWMAKEGLALLKFESFLELLADLDTPYMLLFLKCKRDANRIANILTCFV